jgi:hypothetical protein
MTQQRTAIEVIYFTNKDLAPDMAAILTSAMYLNEVPVKSGHAIYLVKNKSNMTIRRLLEEGMENRNAAEAWIMTVFRARTYNITFMADPKHYFAETIRLIKKVD